MTYCRINLSDTNYSEIHNYSLLTNPDIEQLNLIYQQYCRHKEFSSVMPLFDSDYCGSNIDVLGYYNHQKELVAFSLIKKHDQLNAEALQFAWDYQQPKLRLGIRSLENECALYKKLGYQYLYLGLIDDYKRQFDGFEILGPI